MFFYSTVFCCCVDVGTAWWLLCSGEVSNAYTDLCCISPARALESLGDSYDLWSMNPEPGRLLNAAYSDLDTHYFKIQRFFNHSFYTYWKCSDSLSENALLNSVWWYLQHLRCGVWFWFGFVCVVFLLFCFVLLVVVFRLTAVVFAGEQLQIRGGLWEIRDYTRWSGLDRAAQDFIGNLQRLVNVKCMAVKAVQDCAGWEENLNCLCMLLGYQLFEANLKRDIGISEQANNISAVIKLYTLLCYRR